MRPKNILSLSKEFKTPVVNGIVITNDNQRQARGDFLQTGKAKQISKAVIKIERKTKVIGRLSTKIPEILIIISPIKLVTKILCMALV